MVVVTVERAVVGSIILGLLLTWIAGLIGALVPEARQAMFAVLYTGIVIVSGGLITGGVMDPERGTGARAAMIVMGTILLLVLVWVLVGALVAVRPYGY